MRTEIKMPQMSQKTLQSVLALWNKMPGETVRVGEVLCEIETDKVVSEVESPVNGTVTQIFCEEGDEIAAGTVIAIVEN